MPLQPRAPRRATDPQQLRTRTTPSTASGRALQGPVGQYRHDLTTDRWWWSLETYLIHGFEPHEIVPTTELVLAHKHPEDRERFRQLLEDARVTGDPFMSTHRIMDARGHERIVCLVGQGRRDPSTGDVVELMGYVADITSTVNQHAERIADGHIRASVAHRATIEQAKGALAAIFDTGIEDAFALLRAASNDSNVAVRTLSGWLVDLIRVPPADGKRRRQVDEFLRHPTLPAGGYERQGR